MASLAPILKKANLVLVTGFAFYLSTLCLATIPFFQRHIIYAHKVQTLFWHDVNKPERFGFARNQVTPFRLATPDHESLYAWHVLPLGLYAKHEEELLAGPSGCVEDIQQTKAFQLLKDDQEARLIIEFHGNTGHVAQGWRTDSYKSLVDGDTSKIHILAIDYRGFGLSTGSPTEKGLITDGIAAVDWAINVAKVPSSKILILGQSLGTVVASAVAAHFAQAGTDFAGVILIAGFTDIPNLLTSYSIGGLVPYLSPLKRTPFLQNLFSSYFVDTWDSASRLADLIAYSRKCRLTLFHAKNDYDIPWTMSDALFAAAANATSSAGDGYSVELFDKMKARHTVHGPDGGFVSEWKVSQNRIVREEILASGGHNRIMTYGPVALAVWKSFELDKDASTSLPSQPTEYYVN